jgi:hypothetical protein
MVYVDINYYSADYRGTEIEYSDFPHLAVRASSVIDTLTYNRAAAVVTAGIDTETIAAIKNATCAVAEALQKIERSEAGGEIAAERVGEHSVTYAQSYNSKLSPGKRLSLAAKTYLGLTGLMYAGVEDAS